jgi:hypothetical protein
MFTHLMQLVYSPRIRSLVSNAVDLFMEMDRWVDRHVALASGLRTMECRMRKVCPACLYKVPISFFFFSAKILIDAFKADDEPALFPSMIVSIDGNESQRRDASSKTDNRIFHSHFYINEEYVDRFSNEVNRPKEKVGSETPRFYHLIYFKG